MRATFATVGAAAVRRGWIIGCVVWSLVGPSAEAAPEPAPGWSGRIVRAGFEDIGPPFSFRDPRGEPQGYAVDLVRAVTQRRNLHLEIVMKSWPEVLTDFRAGKLDLLGNVGYLPERAEYMDFSVRTLSLDAGVYVKRGSPLRTLEDLRGKRVAALEQSVAHRFLAAQPWGVELVPVPSRRAAAEAVRSGKCDAFVLMAIIMDHYLRTSEFGASLERSRVRLPSSPYQMHIAVRKDAPELLREINEGIVELARADEEAVLYERWVGPLRESRPYRWSQMKYFVYSLITLSAALVVASILLGWQRERLLRSRAQTAALQRSESELKTIANLVPALISYISPDYRYVRVNRAYEKWFQRPLDQIVGQRLVDLTGPELHARVKPHLEAAFAGRIVSFENEVPFADGVRRWVKATYTPHVGPAGRVEGVTFVAFDLTEMKRAHDELALRGAALEAAANAIVITDADGRVLWTNAAYSRLTGYSLAEVRGRRVGAFCSTGERANPFFAEMWAAISAGSVWRSEILNYHRDGHTFTEEVTITPLLDASGKVTHCIAIKQDVTDQRDLEKQYLHAQRQESLGRLATGIAHDLNNILTPVLVLPSLMREVPQDASTLKFLDMIEASAHRGSDLLRQLLLFGRGSDARREPVALAMMVDAMAGIVRETFPKNITIEMSLAPKLPVISADATQLHQVLMNLCVNARDAMPLGGRLTLRLERTTLSVEQAKTLTSARAGTFQVLTVADTGCGIPFENQERVFEPFFTTKAVGEGTGLGLSTVSGIVRGHAGFIELRSAPGAGTTFKIYLPELAASAKDDGGRDDRVQDGAGRCVLVVDDEPNIARTIVALLETHGYRTRIARHGAEALAILREPTAKIDAIVTDLLMPTMDGLAFIETLRKLGRAYPTVVISGHLTSAEIIGKLDPARPVEVVSKPFTIQQLLGAIERSFVATKS
ncbi:MAG: transporter substrate-binding domain-containing protein [Opitutae bacterium]|nr:transporter substrate-binding domain-containing protein [Opitutae bacterium]